MSRRCAHAAHYPRLRAPVGAKPAEGISCPAYGPPGQARGLRTCACRIAILPRRTDAARGREVNFVNIPHTCTHRKLLTSPSDAQAQSEEGMIVPAAASARRTHAV